MARLDHVTLRGASLQNARFYGATSLAIDFTASQMPHADLSHFQAVGADFSQANLNGALLHAAQLPSALWHDTILDNVRRDDTELREAELWQPAVQLFCEPIMNPTTTSPTLPDTDPPLAVSSTPRHAPTNHPPPE